LSLAVIKSELERRPWMRGSLLREEGTDTQRLFCSKEQVHSVETEIWPDS